MTRASALAPHRLLIAGIVALLALLVFLFLRGPAFWQQRYYPLPAEQRDSIARAAEAHEVNPYLIAAIIDAESGWEQDVVSEAGAVGFMQVLPETAIELRRRNLVERRFDPGDLSDPDVNIEYGTAYFRTLVERYHEIETALAAYNAGMGNVDDWLNNEGNIREQIEFPETRHYVLRVSRARDVYERLYPDAFAEME
ncbi:MAG: lytic transglycosylase domain-containing protein [Coriobacteriia bacterium]